ncbi:MAG: hypothetical protein CMP52_00725 [Flavobacteriales bacterium]|nr:hypothetical protein [Candidatus Arcticimaribacter sp.]
MNPKQVLKPFFQLNMKEKNFTHKWCVYVVVPQEKISYHWQYEEYAGDSTVTFELKEIKNGILLTLTARILDPFP